MWVNYTSKTNKLIEKEIRFVVTRGGGGGKEDWRKVVQRYKPPVTRQTAVRDVVSSTTKRTDTAVRYKRRLLAD